VNTADEALKADPGLKVVIFLNYINKPQGEDRVSNVDEVYNALAALGYEPLVLVGCLDLNTRDWVINSFQTNPRYRAIIVSMDLGVGIDLHATEKGHSRLILLSPDHSLISMEQAKMRVIRQGMDEEREVRIEVIYLDGKESEMNIMNKLAAKKDNVKGMLNQVNQERRTFIPDMLIEKRQAV
jgi:superfamily II DNA or RNA helicase